MPAPDEPRAGWLGELWPALVAIATVVAATLALVQIVRLAGC